MEMKYYNRLEFNHDYMQLSHHAMRSLMYSNAGGSSRISEAISIDYLGNMFDSHEIVLEQEVEYWIDYKKVDFIIRGRYCNIGVSVTRVMGFPSDDRLTYLQVLHFLENKLQDLEIARECVGFQHTFKCGLLHVWCRTRKARKLVRKVLSRIAIPTNVMVLCTLTRYDHIYDENKHNYLKYLDRLQNEHRALE